MADNSHLADKENALYYAPLISSRASIGVGQAVNPRNTPSDIEFQVANPAFASIDERAVLRKMDVRLIPMLAMLYLMSFLDRGNIGNAKIEGLTDDLHMTGQDYSWALTAFFFTYVAIEVPANLLLKRLKPSIWFPMIMFAWGVVMTLMGIVQSFDGLVAARLFLGVAEGGLFPGIVYYITMWYCPHEAQYRQALFFAGAGMAGAFSGVLAFGIGKMSGVGGLEGWRWIFILEGLLTIVVAAVSYFLMFDYPETATFLTENERAWVIERLKHQGSRDSKCIIAQKETFQWKYVTAAFTDWQVLVAMFMNLGFMCPIYAISAFLPTIIQDLGYTAADAQLLSAPPYVAAAITAVVVAIFADRYGRRSPFVISCQILAAIGWMIIIIGSVKSISGLVYGGVFITVIGLYSGFPGNIAWISSNVEGGYKRSVALAIHVGFGNLGGIYSANWYRSQDAPQYILGHSLSLAVVVLGLIAALTLRFGYQQENRRRDAEGIPEGWTQEQMSSMGDRNPAFRYVR